MGLKSLATDLDHQLPQSIALRKLGYDVLIENKTGPSSHAQSVGLTMFYRSLQTHEAAEILVRAGLVEDARILARVMVEQEVNCAYMLLLGDDQAVSDFVDYPKYKNYKILQDLKKTDESRLRSEVSLELEGKVRAQYDLLHMRFKDRRNGEWCADGPLHERAKKVDDHIAGKLKQSYSQFRWLVNSEWRFSSSHVHGMADVLAEQISKQGEVVTIEQKFDPEEAAETMYCSNFALGLALHLVDQSLGGKKANEILAQFHEFNQ
jgi:uncharacterized protein DUF5677